MRRQDASMRLFSKWVGNLVKSIWILVNACDDLVNGYSYLANGRCYLANNFSY